MVKKILYTSNFVREYRRLSEEVKDKAEKMEKVFRQNPFDRRLKTHKLQGKFSDFWSFSIAYK